MTDLRRLLPGEMDALFEGMDLPRYRADQVLRATWRDLARDVQEITTLPGALRTRLATGGHRFQEAMEVTRQESADGSTTKALLRMPGGTLIETVLMQYESAEEGRMPRSTVCVSTQAGCAMGCVFCATGQMGFERNLKAEEIVAQVVHVQRILRERGQHVTNVVFMGMGEPLANYTETVRALRLLTDARAFGLAQRSITVSTVGLVSAIGRLAREGLQVGLAISLHAAEDELRRQLVPTASPHSAGDLVEAARDYFEVTGRRVTFEYALMAGVNDSAAQARKLAGRLARKPVHVNLIPVNPTAGGFQRPTREDVIAFERVLQDAGIATTVRVEKGAEMAAACGQLRTDTAAISGRNAAPVHGRRQAALGREPSRGQ